MISLLEYSFFQNALCGILLISLVSSLVGTYIVTRRMVFISGGITHACFGGLGLGYFLGVSPMLMAALFAVGGSLGVDWLASGRTRKDSAIAVVWAVGMALGILFVSLSTGNVPELNSFLFGNVLTISQSDLWLFLGFGALLLLIYILLLPVIEMISFDQDFARTRQLPVKTVNILMTVMVSVGIVLTIRMIGIMLLMSLMSLPQMTAERFTNSYRTLIIFSCVISMVGCICGLFISSWIAVPASAAIVLLLVVIFSLFSIPGLTLKLKKHRN